MRAWQPGLIDIEANAKMKRVEGLVTKLTYRWGRRSFAVAETVLHASPPDLYKVRYVLKGMHHTITHSFESIGSSATAWTADSEIRFRGFMRLFGHRLQAGLAEQNRILMENFKRYLEQS